LGFVAFMDPPKLTARESIKQIEKSGIALKVLTGDNEFVTKKVCDELGFKISRIVLGDEIAKMDDDAILKVVEKSNIFCRVNPIQKDRILLALKKNGHVVGYLGDGINDAPSMKAADVSISVSNAVDIAKETADIILIHKDLKVLHNGVLEGRKTFGNTMKYIMMGTSSNFGNMFSVAGASLFLPFLPMSATQILLNNLLYDASELTIPTDNIDEEYSLKPKRWDVSYIKQFMIYFGPISSIFDFLTFFIMLFVFQASTPLFQTAWFIESLCTQTLVIFVIRTRKTPFYRSIPSRLLLLSSLSVVAIALAIPLTPLGALFEFTAPPFMFYIILAGLIAAYLALVEIVKKRFYKRYLHLVEKM
jgi:Mg2+-importing ATPase